MATLPLILDSQRFEAGQRQASRSMDRLERDSRKLRGSMRQNQDSMDKAGRSAAMLKRAFVGLAAGISATMVISSSTRAFASYERTMATVGGVTSASADELQRLGETARLMGATTEFTANQAGEGLLFLARAGFSVNEAISALPDTLNLAIAGALDLGNAADIASNVLSQFGIEAEETARIGDVLVNTANSANTDVQQLAEAMKMAGPVAGALGRSVEETAAAIGVLSNSGIQASLAGTNLRGVMAALLQPTTQAQEALDRMGASLEDLSPATNSFADIAAVLAEKNLNAADSVAIFGRRNAAAALVLARSADDVARLTEANENAEGSARRLADILSDTLIGSFRSLFSALNERAFQILEGPLIQSFRTVIDFVRDVVVILNGMEDTLKDGVAPGAREVARALEAMTVAGATFLAIGIAGKLASIQVALGGIAVAIRGALIALGPVGIAVTLISSLIGIIFTLRDRVVEVGDVTTTVGDIVGAVWERVRLLTEAGVQFITSAVELSINEILSLWEDFKGAVETQVGDLFGFLGVNANQYFQDMMSGGRMLLNFFIGIFVSIKDAFVAQFQGVQDALQSLLQVLRDPSIRNVGDALSDVGSVINPVNLMNPLSGISGTDIRRNLFETDFVGQAGDILKNPISEGLAQGFREGVDEIVANSPELQQTLKELAKAGFSVDDILADAQGRTQERARLAEEEASKRAQEAENARRQAEELARAEAEVAAVKERSANAAEREADATVRIVEQRLRAVDAIIESQNQAADLRTLLQFQRQGATPEEARRIAGLSSDRQDFRSMLEGTELSDESKNRLVEEFTEARIAISEAETALSDYENSVLRVELASDRMAGAIVGAFEDVAIRGESLNDVMLQLSRTISQMILRATVLNPLQEAISGGFAGNSVFQSIFSAKGNVFDKGEVKYFAQGGAFTNQIVDHPMAAPMAVFGEKTEEAIMPLRRMSNGNLGVEATQAPSQPQTRTVTVNVTQNIQTPNADSFRRSQTQVARSLQRTTRNALEDV